jgi:hypothetical protein
VFAHLASDERPDKLPDNLPDRKQRASAPNALDLMADANASSEDECDGNEA